jgi:hypothetical protein
MKVSTILDSIDIGAMALPEFQRGYVWNRDQVRGLMGSLYRGHPVGSLLVWVTKTETADARGDQDLQPGVVNLLLDGQQRMQNNPLWIDVTELMQGGVASASTRLMHDLDIDQHQLEIYMNRLNAIIQIKGREFHVEQVTGEDKTVDVVVDIFNRVNSGGTKLSKGDLALARISAAWPQARGEMKGRLLRWRNANFHFRLDWLLRCVNTVTTGEARFEALADVTTAEFQRGLASASDAVDRTLDLFHSRLGIDHDRVLGGRYAFPIITHYLVRSNGFGDYHERDKLLYWYVHSFLWGRFTGSTESALNQDLEVMEDLDGGLDRLIEQLRQVRGDLTVTPEDFRGWSRGSRFYPLMYMLTRVWHAKDWGGEGKELRNYFLHRLGGLQLHHIFPKAKLYKHDYGRREVNSLANFTFLTQETNLEISDRDPVEYFGDVMRKYPGALESHWIPMDRDLWEYENYPDFLAERQQLLAKAANDFLNSLYDGAVPEVEAGEVPSIFEWETVEVVGGVATDEEERMLREVNDWILRMGLPEGEYMYELADEESEQPLALIDLAWPNGLQEGLSDPVAILIDEGMETETVVNQAGYRFFTNPDDFYAYVNREILATEEALA